MILRFNFSWKRFSILYKGICDAKLIKSFEKIKSFSSYTFSLQLFLMILG